MKIGTPKTSSVSARCSIAASSVRRAALVTIVVVRPGVPTDTDKSSQRLTEAGANTVATSLTEARTQATQLLLPALVRSVEPDSIIGAVQLAGSPA
jgi:hypothetical protein